MNLSRLRLVSIVVPVAFLLALEVLSIFVLSPLIPNDVARLALVGGIFLIAAAMFAVWVFSVIREQEQELRRSAEILSTVSDAIYMLDPDGHVLSWNPGAEQLHQYPAAEIIGQPVKLLYTEEDATRDLPASHLADAADAGHIEYEGWRLRRDGSRFWAHVVLTAIRGGSGALLGYSKVSRDITDRKLFEEQIQRLNKELEVRVSELGRANEQAERRHRQLAVANEAIAAISTDLTTDTVLQRIVDAARKVAQCQYAALGVADAAGKLQLFITSGLTPAERESIGPLPEGHGLLGVLVRDKIPLRIADIRTHPQSSGFPSNHPPMKSLLGVPIVYQGEAVGDLYLTNKMGASEFSSEDEELLLLLANHAAVAITNSRLFDEARTIRDQLQVLNRELEAKVAERTRQIRDQSSQLTKRILQAQEEERKRIARELHDETAQSLSTLLISIDLLEQQMPQGEADILLGLERLRILAKRTLDETRALSHDLRPTILDDVGLVAAIQWFADEWAATFDIRVEVEADSGYDHRLGPEAELALFRIAQEAMTNVGKYSEANSVRVSLDFTDDAARLVVVDDGKGFDPAGLSAPSRRGGLGLHGMRERAELIGATLNIESAPGNGTRIEVTAPA